MLRKLLYILISLALIGCAEPIKISRTVDVEADIFPDYKGVTIPPNIAPLNFRLNNQFEESGVIFSSGTYKLDVRVKDGQVSIPQNKWKELLSSATDGYIKVSVCYEENGEWIGLKDFQLQVAKEPIDPYLVYRLIEPGYELYNQLGIYQRNLENFDETPIMENKMTDNNCMNCHSFRMQEADDMLFHMRVANAGTYIIQGDKVEKLNTKTDQTISALVYPYWHSSGKYVAFSVNDTKQGFHTQSKNRVEVFDQKADVVVYDVNKHEIVTTPQLFSKAQYENFPSFSPDGKTLYFCSADTCKLPEEFGKVKYNLCAISFDPETRTFGSVVDTLYNARIDGHSASFPRVSPDGKYLLYTRGDYGGFLVWHKEADLYMIDLATKEHYPLGAANSNDAESYHSWTSNSKWIVFSSRRIDGLYTRPFIAYIDDKGQAHKAFVLPQKDVNFYQNFMKSYNVPEFVKEKVDIPRGEVIKKAKDDKGIDVTFSAN